LPSSVCSRGSVIRRKRKRGTMADSFQKTTDNQFGFDYKKVCKYEKFR
jgi:hypothetical protein